MTPSTQDNPQSTLAPDQEKATYLHRQLTSVAAKSARSPRKIPMELIEDALHEHSGNVSQAAKALRTSYANLARIVDSTTALVALCESYRTELFELAERNLRVALDAGNLKATLFTLQRLGKDRGYAERKEVETTVTQRTALDLTKLSTDQLTKMRDMLSDAGVVTGEFIDITPSDDEEESGDDVT